MSGEDITMSDEDIPNLRLLRFIGKLITLKNANRQIYIDLDEALDKVTSNQELHKNAERCKRTSEIEDLRSNTLGLYQLRDDLLRNVTLFEEALKEKLESRTIAIDGQDSAIEELGVWYIELSKTFQKHKRYIDQGKENIEELYTSLQPCTLFRKRFNRPLEAPANKEFTCQKCDVELRSGMQIRQCPTCREFYHIHCVELWFTDRENRGPYMCRCCRQLLIPG